MAFRGQIYGLTLDTKPECQHPKLLSIIICHQIVLLLNTWGEKNHLWQQLSLIHVVVNVLESFALDFLKTRVFQREAKHISSESLLSSRTFVLSSF